MSWLLHAFFLLHKLHLIVITLISPIIMNQYPMEMIVHDLLVHLYYHHIFPISCVACPSSSVLNVNEY